MYRSFLIALLALPSLAFGADVEKTLVIQNHLFTPVEIRVPAGKQVRLIIDNQDETPEEFHSNRLRKEKVVLGKSREILVIGPLKPGKYPFMGELHAKTARGVVIAE